MPQVGAVGAQSSPRVPALSPRGRRAGEGRRRGQPPAIDNPRPRQPKTADRRARPSPGTSTHPTARRECPRDRAENTGGRWGETGFGGKRRGFRGAVCREPGLAADRRPLAALMLQPACADSGLTPPRGYGFPAGEVPGPRRHRRSVSGARGKQAKSPGGYDPGGTSALCAPLPKQPKPGPARPRGLRSRRGEQRVGAAAAPARQCRCLRRARRMRRAGGPRAGTLRR